MKTYAEWLEEFGTKIREGYEAHRMDKRLCGFAYEAKKPARTLWKYDQPIAAHTVSEGQRIFEILPTPKYRAVEPLQRGVIVDLSKRYFPEIEVIGLDSLMFRYGSWVAEREYWAIVKGMSDNAGETMKAKDQGELSKLDVRTAQTWISQNGSTHADMIVMPLKQKTELLKKEELWPPYKIPNGYIPEKDRGRYFSGMMDGTKTYWMRFIKDFALVYAKSEIIVINTPLEVYYDNPERPSQLIIEKCVKEKEKPLLKALIKVKAKNEEFDLEQIYNMNDFMFTIEKLLEKLYD